MNALVGTGKLAWLILRRDRIVLPLWTILLGSLPVFYASAIDGLYPTAAQLQSFFESVDANTSLITLQGPAFGPSLGALSTWRAGLLPVFIGLASALTVIRHTRADEDAGRRELLGATVVGRHAPLAAALLVTAGANVVMGAVIALTMMAYGLPAAGSIALGLAFGFVGVLFAAVAAIAAQLTEGAGAARGIALAALGAAFLLRAAGDTGGYVWLSWLSPIGWAQRVRPYAGERWWVLLLLLAAIAAFVATANALLSRRDVGAGVLPARLGPASASPRLRSPIALAWRLHRGLLLGWSAGFAVIGFVIGGASKSIDQLVEDSPQLVTMLERLGGLTSLKDTYLAVSLGMIALAAAAYAVQATLRLRAEETDGRAEYVLATAVGRISWLLSHVLFALVGSAVVMLVVGVTTGLASADSGSVGSQVSRVVGGALVQVPAIWVLAGFALAMFGLLPRLAAALAWGVLSACVFLSFVGPLLRLDQLILDASPFTHIPMVPNEDLRLAPVAALLAIAAALAIAGAAGFRRRDLASV